MRLGQIKFHKKWKSVKIYIIHWEDVALYKAILGSLGFLKEESFVPEMFPTVKRPRWPNFAYGLFRERLNIVTQRFLFIPPLPRIKLKDEVVNGREDDLEAIFLFGKKKDMVDFISRFVVPDERNAYPLVRWMVDRKFDLKKYLVRSDKNTLLPDFPAFWENNALQIFTNTRSMGIGVGVRTPLIGMRFPSFFAYREHLSGNVEGIRIVLWDGLRKRSWLLNPGNVTEELLTQLFGKKIYDKFNSDGFLLPYELVKGLFTLPPIFVTHIIKLERRKSNVFDSEVYSKEQTPPPIPVGSVVVPALIPVYYGDNLVEISGDTAWEVLAHLSGIFYHPNHLNSTIPVIIRENTWFLGGRFL